MLDQQDSPLYCSALWHIMRLSGPGAALAYPLYDVMLRVARKTGCFSMSLARLAPYLNASKEQLGRAAELLVANGWLERLPQHANRWNNHVRERKDWNRNARTPDSPPNLGVPTRFRPVVHSRAEEDGISGASWVESHPGLCCEKLAMPWKVEDAFAPILGAALGNKRIFPNVIKGWRDRSKMTDDEILSAARAFMTTPGALKGRGFMRAFGEFLTSKQ